MREISRVLHYPRIQKRYRLTEETITAYLERLYEVSTLVTTHTRIGPISKDPDDDKFLECAIAGSARYIVSGDPHLLDIGEYSGIQIVSPDAFLAMLEKQRYQEGRE